jgi:hypothetical protein
LRRKNGLLGRDFVFADHICIAKRLIKKFDISRYFEEAPVADWNSFNGDDGEIVGLY